MSSDSSFHISTQMPETDLKNNISRTKLRGNLQNLTFFLNISYLRKWTTQRDGMGREEGGGFRMGNTCIPVADSF